MSMILTYTEYQCKDPLGKVQRRLSIPKKP